MFTKRRLLIIGTVIVITPLAIPLLKEVYLRFFKRGFHQHRSLLKRLMTLIEQKYLAPNSSIVKMEAEENHDIVELHEREGFNYVSIQCLRSQERSDKVARPINNDPFLPPFDNGIFITDLGKTHRLIFNKYMVSKYHVLVVTKIFMLQTEPLVEADFKYGYLVLAALDGFAFFNSDKTAGSSQLHKHLQIVSYKYFQTFYLAKILGIVANYSRSDVLQSEGLGVSVLEFPFLENYKHTLVSFREFNAYSDDLDKYSIYLQRVYQFCWELLRCQNTDHSHNLLFGKNWMLLILRKKEKFNGIISVNAVGCIGKISVASKEKFQKLKNAHPSDIYSEILVDKSDSAEYLINNDD